jgi:hypothetical protein
MESSINKQNSGISSAVDLKMEGCGVDLFNKKLEINLFEGNEK